MLTIKIRRYNATDCECSLCGVIADNVWKFGRVSVTQRAHHFCDECMKLVDTADAVS